MPDEEQKATGRPTLYSPELSDRICGQIAQGYSLRTITKAKSMPCMATIFSWLRTNKPFLEQYEKSKQEQADAMAEEMLDIADNGTNDWMEKTNEETGETYGWKVNGEHIQRSRLRIDTRKWLASKLKPKKYGESTTIKGDAENPLITKPVDITQQILALIPTEELERIQQEALSGGTDSN